jgi:hypothetical protein
MIDFFKKLLDTATTFSSNRFAFLFTTLISNIVFWLVWAGVSSYKGEMVDVPTGVYIIYGLANGIVGLGKLGQNLSEFKAEPKP